jgi:tetratricopeptide (TPR) repeat protein
MLCELSKAEKSRPRAKFLPLFFLNLLLHFFLNLVLTGFAPSANAQSSDLVETTGTISGTVLSQGDNRTLSQVAVRLKSHAAGVFHSILTDYDGHFEVGGLPPGSYEINVEESGYDAVQTKAQLEGPALKLVLYLTPVKWSQAHQNNYTVSVRDLKIAGKARDEYQKGMECLAKNDFGASVDHFTKAIKAFPEFYEALSQLGMAEVHLGSTEEARKAFQAAIDFSKGRYAPAQFGFGYLLCLEGKAAEAEAILRRGLEVDGSAPDGHVILGAALLALNRLDEAEKSAGEALLRKPGFAEAYLVLADVYARRRNYQEQLQDLETYLRLEPRGPGSARAHHAREVALKMLGERSPQN